MQLEVNQRVILRPVYKAKCRTLALEKYVILQ